MHASAHLLAYLPTTLLLMSLSTGCATQKELLEKEPVNVAVEHLIQAVDRAIEIAYQRHGDQLGLTLTEVSLQLKTVVDTASSQDLTISVLEIEASEDESFTQTLTLTLDPPSKKPDTTPPSGTAANPRLIERLDQGIEAAILAAKGAQTGLERLHPDGIPLETQKIKVAMAFAVTTTGDGLPSISILGIDLTAEKSRERAHTITLTFEIKDNDGI